ncbi:uncharacterized protein LOC105196401 [Solenopsis invicta]|uniref:uncharacterized protein LOC105196401 n=1 Tax=Solenopsis invicta TaxID=13686 RepID=UPI0005959FB0|nr:uncharacterized protein LOC105196401 [Solenopsis invicta]
MVFKLGLVIMVTFASCLADEGYSYERPDKSFDREDNYKPRDQSNDDGILGAAGKDYPIFNKVPWTQFACEWRYPGYYADPEANCQVFHICQRGGQKDSFLCPNGTLFNQETLVCMWWYTVDCSRAQSFYSINEAVAKAMEEADSRIRTQKLLWNNQRDYDENTSGNMNWQDILREPKKDNTLIRHNQDLDDYKQLPGETLAHSKFSAKTLPNDNIRYENRPWNKNWEDILQTPNKDSTLIRHNQDLDDAKQRPGETLAHSKFFAKTLPNDNIRYENRPWNKNWEDILQTPNKDSTLIRHNQDLDDSKQRPGETLAHSKFSAKTLPYDNIRYENRFWNKNWQNILRGWNKGSTLIRHNQNLDVSKQRPDETLAYSKFSAKTLPNNNARYNSYNSSKSNNKIDAATEKQATLQRPRAFYLPM